MSLTPNRGPRKPLSELFQPQHTFPAALTSLKRWGVYRTRVRKGRDRPIVEALHPATGHELLVSKPDTWVTFAESFCPRGRKPYDGVGFLVRDEDGLAVIRAATPAQAELLADAVVHLTQEVGGTGLVLIVRARVDGAKTNCFVPLSGQTPYQAPETDLGGSCPDALRTDSGRGPYQADALSGRGPYQDNRVCPDGARVLLSSSPPEIHDDGVEEDPVDNKLAELANEILEQGMSRGTDDNWRWLYSIISLLQVHGLTADEVTPHLLRKIAEMLGVDADDLQARVVARWNKLDPSRGLLADALRAVRADPALLKDLHLANPNALLIAGMARYMGCEGKPFRLHQVSLAQVLGLPGQQAVSPLVRSLREKGWLRLVGAHKYAGPKKGRLAAEYVWTGPGAVEPRTAAEVVATTPVRAAAPHPPPRVSVAPPPSPCRAVKERRPGFSAERDDVHRFESRFGGHLTVDYYLAEVMVARHLKREGKDLHETFWRKDKLGRENEAQAAATRKLLKDYLPSDIHAAIKADEGKRLYSLWGPWAEGLVKEQARMRQMKAVLAERDAQRAQAASNERMNEATAEQPKPAPVLQTPRHAIVPRKRSAFALVKESDARRGLTPCPA